eukprot:scaffold86197_cov67-Phaeocystis_antarctica.AAC.10
MAAPHTDIHAVRSKSQVLTAASPSQSSSLAHGVSDCAMPSESMPRQAAEMQLVASGAVARRRV